VQRGLAFLCAILAAGCSPKPRGWLRLANGALPNVLLITIDTLRADHVSCYATRFGNLTPNLNRFASGATVFLNATTAAPATVPALASLHTGLYPGRHAVRTNLQQLGYGSRLLAESLRANGYTTAAYYGNSLLVPKSGFRRGFDTYVSFVSLAGPSDARGADLAREWLEQHPATPWFLWVHFMDPHGPYDSAPPSWSDTLAANDPLPDRELPISSSNYGLNVIPKYQALPGLTRASDYRRRYRGEIRFTDEQVGRLLATVDALGVLPTTLVIITADHGENLGEHECYFQHGWFPYEEAVHVPLLIRLPGRAGAARRVPDPVSLVDIVPTVLAGLDLPTAEQFDGRDISALLRGARLPQTPAFAVTAYLNQITSVRIGDWKLVHTPPPPPPVRGDPWADFYRSAEQFELYNLERDPDESHNLYATQPEEARQLWRVLAVWQTAHHIPFWHQPGPTPDEATQQRLDALGYGAQ